MGAPVVPTDPIARVAFYAARTAGWTSNATAIGTTTSAVSDLATKVAAEQAARNAQTAAKAAAKTATLTLKSAVQAVSLAGSDIMKQIRTKAAITGGTSVYELANIPAPATPTPVGNPGTPEGFKVKLMQDGSLKLTWKCANPVGAAGTIYQISRRNSATGEFSYIAGVGTRSFTDSTIPAGSSQVTYSIRAVRSTTIGEPGEFNVNFGTSGSGAMVASVSEGAPARIAA